MNTHLTNPRHVSKLCCSLLTAFLVGSLVPRISWAQPAPAAVLVKATDANGRSVLGELKSEQGDNLDLLDMKTGKQLPFLKSTLNDLRKGVSEKEAAETIGLAEFLVWK